MQPKRLKFEVLDDVDRDNADILNLIIIYFNI